MKMKQISYLLFACLLYFSACTSQNQEEAKQAPNTESYSADIIIYGGTSAAVTAAVEATKAGKSAIIVSPDKHLGGLSSGGLGYTDTGNKEVIGGLAREFYHRVYNYYQDDKTWKWQKKEEYGNKGQGTPAMDGDARTMWIFEPHIAEQVFEDFIKEYNITVYRDEWLNRENGVVLKDGKIQSFTTLSGKTFEGKIFMDATYEGDLMAEAGVSYHVGREANSVYGENFNGVQAGVFHHRHYFLEDIDPYKTPGDPSSGLLPKISDQPPGENGEGDDKIQAYCFRMCLSRHPENRVPFPKPDNYDPANYELLARVFASGWRETFHKYDPIPNWKTDTNNHGPFSTDNIGMNYGYPEASYEERKAIIKEHEDYQKGLMYYLSHNEKVPEEVRKEMAQWGLAKDEFTDNGNWPHQIYVREARRMIGDFVMTEKEVMGDIPLDRSIGMGSYAMDSHNTQRFVTKDGFVQNEGDIGVHPHQPYQIDYGSIVPKKGECPNLLVPVCVSSSHIAFGSIRMEPVFMILGQSAASAAILAIDKNISVQEVAYTDLRPLLEKGLQRLEYKKEN
ncbi:FAD-dependent oxidoreductase [Flexithrix dorotheae]|uniref:FAD-dependent oxidoreductase n=1 Tax=Flexithrix dorotheae TaxID=70993 RepID=UPI00036A2C0A